MKSKFGPNWLIFWLMLIGIMISLLVYSSNLIRKTSKEMDNQLKILEMLTVENNELRSRIEALTAKEVITENASKKLGMIFSTDELEIFSISKRELRKFQDE